MVYPLNFIVIHRFTKPILKTGLKIATLELSRKILVILNIQIIDNRNFDFFLTRKKCVIARYLVVTRKCVMPTINQNHFIRFLTADIIF